MSTMVEDPTTIRELTRYVEREHPDLRTLLNDHHEQLVVVGQPGHPEPAAALREVLGSSGFEIQAETADSRGRWLSVVSGRGDEGGNR
jgi:hypothetical protein